MMLQEPATDAQEAQREELVDTVNSICTFAVDRTIAPPAGDKKKQPKPKDEEQLFMTSDILERVLELNGMTSEFVQSEDPTDADSSNRALLYILTEENRSISCLLDVLKFNQRRSPSKGTEHASRFLFGKLTTKSEDLFQFLVRAAQDPTDVFYYMVDLHLLPAHVAQTLLKDLKFVFFSGKQKSSNYNLVLFMNEKADKSILQTELQRSNKYYKNLKFQMESVSHQELRHQDILKDVNPVIVESDMSGMGKSSHIKQQAVVDKLELVSVNLSGEVSPQGTMRRVAIIKERARTGKGMILHIKLDMVENFEDNSQIIDQLLFELCFLKCVRFGEGYVVLDKVVKIFLELQNTCKESYYEKISFLLSIKTTPKCIHRIHQFKNIEDLKLALKVEMWSEVDREICHRLCVVLKHLDKFAAHKVKPAALSTVKREDSMKIFHTRHKDATEMNLSLADMLNKYVFTGNGKHVKDTAFVQIRSWVKSLYHQFIELENTPALNLAFLDLLTPYSTKITALRKSMMEDIIKCSVNITWGAAAEIRTQTKEVKEILLAAKDKMNKGEDLVQKIKEIPNWLDSKFVNYLIHNGVVTPIYSAVKDVPPQVDQNLMALSGSKVPVVVDYDETPNGSEVMFRKLFEALLPSPNIRELIQKAQEYQGKGFSLTQETYSKILMMFQQAQLNIPIVIMGPTGCGKTYLVSFTAECLLGDHFENLTLHPGVTEEQLKDRLLKCYQEAQKSLENAETLAAQSRNERRVGKTTPPTNAETEFDEEDRQKYLRGAKKVWLLFDEFNTSHLQCFGCRNHGHSVSKFPQGFAGLGVPEQSGVCGLLQSVQD
jgi:hypothetical protein